MGISKVLDLVARPVAIAAIVYALLLALSWVSLGADETRARAAVAAAFQSGDLIDFDISGANARIGSHQLNDCLILDQAITRSGTRTQMMLTPPNDLSDRTAAVCQQLRGIVTGDVRGPVNFYQNYIHAHTVLARLFVGALPLDAVRALYGMVIAAMVVAGLWLAMRRALRSGACVAVLFWLCFFLAFARFFGLEYFGQSLGHGPADAVLLAYGLWLEIVSFRDQAKPVDFVIPVAAFGALTTAFEFLTGGIPLGIALTIAGIAVAEQNDARLRESVTRGVCAFVTAIGAMVVIKFTLTVALFGFDAATSTASGLAERLTGAEQLEQTTPMANIVVRLSNGLGQMMGDQPAFVLMILLLALSFGAAGLVQLRRTDLSRRATLIAASNLVLLAWIAVFNHHFYVHALFMVRIFAWTIATGVALFAMAAARQGRRPALISEPAPLT